jgi:hypothetical protein
LHQPDTELTRFLTPDEAAACLVERHGIDATVNLLRRLRTRGGGPVFCRPNGRDARYTQEWLDEWAAKLRARSLHSTAEEFLPPVGRGKVAKPPKVASKVTPPKAALPKPRKTATKPGNPKAAPARAGRGAPPP